MLDLVCNPTFSAPPLCALSLSLSLSFLYLWVISSITRRLYLLPLFTPPNISEHLHFRPSPFKRDISLYTHYLPSTNLCMSHHQRSWTLTSISSISISTSGLRNVPLTKHLWNIWVWSFPKENFVWIQLNLQLLPTGQPWRPWRKFKNFWVFATFTAVL